MGSRLAPHPSPNTHTSRPPPRITLDVILPNEKAEGLDEEGGSSSNSEDLYRQREVKTAEKFLDTVL